MKRQKKIYMQGSVTLEAALVFPLVLFVLFGVIRFGFYIHDITAENMINEYAAVREINMLQSGYDPVNQSVNLREIVNKGIIRFENPYQEQKTQYLYRTIDDYKGRIRMEKDREETGTKRYEGVNAGFKNSTVVRTVHVLMNHAENITALRKRGEND